MDYSLWGWWRLINNLKCERTHEKGRAEELSLRELQPKFNGQLTFSHFNGVGFANVSRRDRGPTDSSAPLTFLSPILIVGTHRTALWRVWRETVFSPN